MVRSLIPDPFLPLARAVYHPLERIRSVLRTWVRLVRLERNLRRRYGRSVSFEIHPDDLMYQWYLRDNVARARTVYLSSGDRNTREFEGILKGLGRTLGPHLSLLDFACGYGRLTRLLVPRLGSDRVTVSDVEPAAVDFVAAAFGVSGFYSVSRADDLDHEGSYDVILVASLFSHLPSREWEAWLTKLYGLLAERGVLVFSTQGISLYATLGAEARAAAGTGLPGFYFLQSNETLGRLDVADYGQTYVEREYVVGLIESHSLGRLLGYYPRALWGRQDVYVVERG